MITILKKHLTTLTTAALTLTATATAREAIPSNVANASNKLGVDLLNALDKKNENICISPYSIYSALLMTHHGAAKNTLQEMEKVLGIDSHPELAVNAHCRYIEDISQRLNKKIPRHFSIDKTQLKIANRIFLEKTYQAEQSFLTLCKDRYSAPVEPLDFKTTADKSRLHINQWVSQQTNEKIKDLLGPGSINKNTKIVLTNCLYFKASWSKAFMKKHTKPTLFHTSEKAIKVDTMHMTHRFGYQQAAEYEALTIPFGAHQNFQMLIILPSQGTSIKKVATGFKKGDLEKLAKLPMHKVALALPKFKLESNSISLKNSLINLGMKNAFAQNANFSNISKSNDINIADVVHKTFIAIDESGAEAAAATAVLMQRTSAKLPDSKKPIEFKVNRPFFFAIQDRVTGHCYFIGNMKKPQ